MRTRSSLTHDLEALTLLDGNVSLQSLGVTPQNVFYSFERANSLGKGPAPTSRLHQVDSWPRRFVSNGSAVSAVPSRSTSDANVVDDLRRRLALAGGGSTSSLGSLSRMAMNGDHRRDSLTSINDSSDPMTSSSMTIRPGPAPLTASRRVNAAGIEVGRVSPAVASDSTTAMGQMNLDMRSPRSEDAVSTFSSAFGARSKLAVQSQRFHSTYGALFPCRCMFLSGSCCRIEGNEPGIRSLLERTYLDGAFEPMPEFGPRVAAGIPRKRAIKASSHKTASSPSNGRPEGTLVAHLTEHTAAITSLTVSPDSVFFITGSDDGTARVWDAMRLEKSVTSRSRQVFRHTARITAVCMLDRSHCVATASADGSLFVHRIDVELSGSLPKYTKAQTIRQMMVEPPGDYITVMSHAYAGEQLEASR